MLAARPTVRTVATAAALAVVAVLAGPAQVSFAGHSSTKTTTTTATTTTTTRTSAGGTGLGWSANLLTGATAALATGAGSWVGAGNASVTGQSGALTVTATGSGGATVNAVVNQGTTPTDLTPATAGQVYRSSISVQGQSVGRNVQVAVYWYDSSGNRLTAAGLTPASKTVTETTTGATTITTLGIAPTGAAYVGLAVIWWATTVGESHLLTSPVLQVSTGAPTAFHAPFHVSGNRIYDVNNKVVVFRGMGREGLELAASDPSLTQYDVARMRSWGANLMRIPLGEQYWLSTDCNYDKSYAARVDQVVKWVTDLGMVALVDLHTNDISRCGSGGQHPMADKAGAPTFWKQVATRYKANPLVAFDLYNEPRDITDAVWLNGGAVQDPSGVTYEAAGMQQLLDAVRGTGATNLAIATTQMNGTLWPTTAPQLSGSNVVFGLHPYVCGDPQLCNTTDNSYELDRFVTPGQTYPIMISEFGWPGDTDDRANGVVYPTGYFANTLAYADRQGWGWSAWKWDTNGQCVAGGWYSLIAASSCGSGQPYEPTPAGMVIMDGLHRN